MLFSGLIANSAYRMSPTNSAASQFTFVTYNSTRRQTDGASQQQATGQAVNSTNNVSVPSTSFLKHSVDSITSSFYALSARDCIQGAVFIWFRAFFKQPAFFWFSDKPVFTHKIVFQSWLDHGKF